MNFIFVFYEMEYKPFCDFRSRNLDINPLSSNEY